MKKKLSVLMITKNSSNTIDKSLLSVKRIADEIIIIDDFSSDKTIKIAKKYNTRIFFHHEENLGKQRIYGLTKTNCYWVLILDSDEVVSKELANEILKIIHKDNLKIDGFIIPYQNHFLGKKVQYGGENYKMLRLFKKTKCVIKQKLIHEKVELKKNALIENLQNNIYHYSYNSIPQLYKKFTNYALREARQRTKNGENTNLKKIIIYPIHMFWARFFKDKGYKDGLFRIPLDLAFAYMEFLSYFIMIFIKKVNNTRNAKN